MKASEPWTDATRQPSERRDWTSHWTRIGQRRYSPLSEPLNSHWTGRSGQPLDTPALFK
jgi:hypothetical protein